MATQGKRYRGAAVVAAMLVVACSSNAKPIGSSAYDDATSEGWASATASGGTGWATGGLLDTRSAQVNWSVPIDGVVSDLLRDGEATLVLSNVDGVATVIRVTEGQGPQTVLSSGQIGRPARFVRRGDDSVFVVGPSADGLVFAPLDGSSAPIPVSLGLDIPEIDGVVAGTGGEFWVALTSGVQSEVVRLAASGAVVGRHGLGLGQEVLGLLRDGNRTIAFGNFDSHAGWTACVPDDGVPSIVNQGWRVTNGWTDGARLTLGFDVGGVGCVADVSCEGSSEMDEVPMPIPQQKAGRWVYGFGGDRVLFSLGTDWSPYAYDAGLSDIVRIDGDDRGNVLVLLHDAVGSRLVEVTH